jgi:AraC-like DNA-binding protein
MSVNVREYKPSQDLAPYIEFFWGGQFNTFSTDLFSQRVVPNGYVELIIHLSDLHCELLDSKSFSSTPEFLIIGLYSLPYQVNFKGVVDTFGIRFKPEGLHQIFGVPASELLHNYTDFENLSLKAIRDHFKGVRKQENISHMIKMTENFFRKNLDGNKINLNYLNMAAELIRKSDGLISVEEISNKVYISKRQLEREFKQKIGLSPKTYMRLARLNKVNRIIQEGKRIDLTEISYVCGYSDQAHFIRDFKNFTGTAPKIFINHKHQYIINPNRYDI